MLLVMPRTFTRAVPESETTQASVEFLVPFHDVDALRIVWHGHDLKYLDLARTELLRSVGLDADDLRAAGHGLLVIESGCRHISPLHYDDRVRVTAWLRDVTHRIQVAYDIRKVTRGQRAARAYTNPVTVDSAERMLLRTPRAILDRLSTTSDPASPTASNEGVR